MVFAVWLCNKWMYDVSSYQILVSSFKQSWMLKFPWRKTPLGVITDDGWCFREMAVLLMLAVKFLPFTGFSFISRSNQLNIFPVKMWKYFIIFLLCLNACSQPWSETRTWPSFRTWRCWGNFLIHIYTHKYWDQSYNLLSKVKGKTNVEM